MVLLLSFLDDPEAPFATFFAAYAWAVYLGILVFTIRELLLCVLFFLLPVTLSGNIMIVSDKTIDGIVGMLKFVALDIM